MISRSFLFCGMFEMQELHWGRHRLCKVWHKDSDSGLLIAPGRGGCLLKLQLRGWDFLCGYQDAAELDSLDWARSAWLFPYPNRLRDGRYTWKGQTYSFPINDAPTGNAIHGFLMNEHMWLHSVLLGPSYTEIKLICDYRGHHPEYPFPMLIELKYSFELDGNFMVDMKIQNWGEQVAPIGWGWHPYFRVGDSSVDTWKLQIPAADVVEVDERMLPTGQLRALDFGSDLQLIGERVFDHCLHLHNPYARLELQGNRGRIRWHQSNFPYLQLFTPPMRDSLAIEPMSCGVDAFNTGEGLIRLKHRKQKEFGVSLNLGVFRG